MYSIGKFSKMTGVSTKTLIWYHSVGLLKPCKVDEESGYRFYDDESLKQLANIHFWQSMDFSVKEIANLSKEIVSEKIDELQNKINFIQSNISFLEEFQEENMKKEKITIFNFEEKLLQGKWLYQKSSTDFNDVIDDFRIGEKEKSMPEYLFFGEDNIGTDLNDTFGYTNCFELVDKSNVRRDFWFFITNYRSTLVLYEKPKDEKAPEPVKFHIYTKLNKTLYTSDDINTLLEKYGPMLDACYFEFNKDFVGNYVMYDEILESEVDSYSGKVKTKDVCHLLDPMFSVFEIQENKDVYVLKSDDQLHLKASNGEKFFNRENTKMTISMGNSKNKFIINNFNGRRHKGMYKKVGDDEFLFINLENNVDLDVELYVFKKVK